MSYSLTEAKGEFFQAIEAADKNEDFEALRKLANDAKGRGEDELADSLIQMAQRHYKNDSYDLTYEDNSDEREAEAAEQHRDWLAEY